MTPGFPLPDPLDPSAPDAAALGAAALDAAALDAAALEELRQAHALLENPGLAAQLANLVGAPLEHVMARRLPRPVARAVDAIVQRTLRQALRAAVASLGKDDASPPRPTAHTVAAATSGALGGAFGFAGLAVELPVTTTLILRSIAGIARAEGESLEDPVTTLACFEVLAMGGRARADDGAESGYFAARALLAHQVAAATEYLAVHGIAGKGAPVIVQLLAAIASRFSVNVSQKLALQAVPLVGAATGATLNALFMRHFQAMARGHFTVRRLERRYGTDAVRRAYAALERPGEGAGSAPPGPPGRTLRP